MSIATLSKRQGLGVPTAIHWTLLLLAGFSLAYLAVAATAFLFSSAPFYRDTVYAATGVGPICVGVLIVSRRRGNLVGQLLVLIGSTWSLGEAGRIYLWLEVQGGPVLASDLAGWFVAWAFAPAWVLVAFLLPVFPSGRLASEWMRWPMRAAVPAVLALTLAGMLLPVELVAYVTYLEGETNPWAIVRDGDGAVWDAIEAAIYGVLVLTIFLALLDLLQRWRRSQTVERLQMRSFALGVLVGIGLLAGALLATAGGVPDVVEPLLGVLAINAPVVAIGVAVTRYRLYEIDRIINRTLVYALLTAGLAATYFGLVVGLEALLRPVSGGSDLAIVLTTLVVAALFLPARRRVQDAVDRRFNRRAYDAARTIDAFSARLREQIELDTLRYELLAVVEETMQPARTMLWLRGRNDSGTRTA